MLCYGLWGGRNGLPPTPDTLHLGCSYHLHSSHRFLSTWGAKKQKQKKLWQHTYGWYSHHRSTAAPIAVGGHNTDTVHHIVGHSDSDVCFISSECTNTWTDSDGVVDWNLTLIQWDLPLDSEVHTVLTKLVNTVGWSLGRRRKTCWTMNKFINITRWKEKELFMLCTIPLSLQCTMPRVVGNKNKVAID